jgi:hypothetical protein
MAVAALIGRDVAGASAVVALLAGGACHHRPRPSMPALAADARCYLAAYFPPTGARMFPTALALAGGPDSGAADWLPAGAADTAGLWKMFSPGGWVRHPGDSLALSFHNGATGVTLIVAQSGDTLRGAATWYGDVITPAPPTRAELLAQRRPCDEVRSGR